MKEILKNYYTSLGSGLGLNKDYDGRGNTPRASFFIRIKIGLKDKLLEVNSSVMASKNTIVVYKDKLILERFDWQFESDC